jgi:hypothetical protein
MAQLLLQLMLGSAFASSMLMFDVFLCASACVRLCAYAILDYLAAYGEPCASTEPD